jgi:biopolymer transport protein ExbD
MRAYRKRPWSSLMVNMTPLIDVVFLIIIFFIIMINFSELHITQINLPRADAARERAAPPPQPMNVTVKSEDTIFVGRKRVALDALTDALKELGPRPAVAVATLRADEGIHYEIIKSVMEKIAAARISRIEFATFDEAPTPLEENAGDEAAAQK